MPKYKVVANLSLRNDHEGQYRFVSLENFLEGNKVVTLEQLFVSLSHQAQVQWGKDFNHIVNIRIVPEEEPVDKKTPKPIGTIKPGTKPGAEKV